MCDTFVILVRYDGVASTETDPRPDDQAAVKYIWAYAHIYDCT